MARFVNSSEQLPPGKRGKRPPLEDDQDEDVRPAKRNKLDDVNGTEQNGSVPETDRPEKVVVPRPGGKAMRVGTKKAPAPPPMEVVGPDIINGVRQRRAHKGELEFCYNVMMPALMTTEDSYLFNQPVDPLKDGCPDYLTVVCRPMDFGTIKGKLARREYDTALDCFADIQLVFDNCRTYNQPESGVVACANRLQRRFQELQRSMPKEGEGPPHPQDLAPPQKQQLKVRKKGEAKGKESDGGEVPGTVVPTIRVKEPQLPQSPVKAKKSKTKSGAPLSEALRYCQNRVLKEMMRDKHNAYSWPFMEVIDQDYVRRYNCPQYFDVIKHPMDLPTMKTKLANGQYKSAREFEADMNLMFNNCYTFNPSGTQVHLDGKSFEAIFRHLWSQVPMEDLSESEDEEEREREREREREKEREREREERKERKRKEKETRKAEKRALKEARRANAQQHDHEVQDPGTIIKLRTAATAGDDEEREVRKKDKEAKASKRKKEKEHKRKASSGSHEHKHKHKHKEKDRDRDEKERKKKKKKRRTEDGGMSHEEGSGLELQLKALTQDEQKQLADKIEELTAEEQQGLLEILKQRDVPMGSGDDFTLELHKYDPVTQHQLVGYVEMKLQAKAREEETGRLSKTHSTGSVASDESESESSSDSDSDSDYRAALPAKKGKSRAGSVPPKSPHPNRAQPHDGPRLTLTHSAHSPTRPPTAQVLPEPKLAKDPPSTVTPHVSPGAAPKPEPKVSVETFKGDSERPQPVKTEPDVGAGVPPAPSEDAGDIKTGVKDEPVALEPPPVPAAASAVVGGGEEQKVVAGGQTEAQQPKEPVRRPTKVETISMTRPQQEVTVNAEALSKLMQARKQGPAGLRRLPTGQLDRRTSVRPIPSGPPQPQQTQAPPPRPLPRGKSPGPPVVQQERPAGSLTPSFTQQREDVREARGIRDESLEERAERRIRERRQHRHEREVQALRAQYNELTWRRVFHSSQPPARPHHQPPPTSHR